jgi:hypothetical protein
MVVNAHNPDDGTTVPRSVVLQTYILMRGAVN